MPTARHRFRRRIGVALGSLALVLSACSGNDDAGSSTPATPPDSAAVETGDGSTGTSPTSAEVPPGSDDVVITTADGERLEGTLLGDGDDGIVLAHMRGADRSTWTEFAEAAADAGFRVLSFDFRGYGGSTGDVDTDLDADLTAAIETLTTAGVDNVVVIGASMGGTATINVASKLDLAGAATLSAPAEFLGLPALDVATEVAEPLLMVAAADDHPYVDTAREVADVRPETTVQIPDGDEHGTNLFDPDREWLTDLLLDFAADAAG